MEGRYLQFVGNPRRQQLADPLLHFLGRLVGEGDGGDIARLEAAFLNQVSNLLGDHTRLAGAGTGEHKQRTVKVMNRFALLGVEAGHGARIPVRG